MAEAPSTKTSTQSTYVFPVDRKNLQSGVICDGIISEHRSPLDSLTEVVNMHFDRIGSATLRKGTTALGGSGVLSGNLLGLHEFRDSGAGTNNQIIAVNGTVAYYLSGTTWTSKRTSLTAASKARFTNFLDFAWMVNGVEATAIWSGATGDSFVTTGNAASAPIGKFIENFRSRVWIAGNATYPDRLYFSSLPSAVTTPIVTWNTSATSGDWIDISPSDGENITALKRAPDAMLIFKNNHIYRVFSISDADADPKYSVGTYSQESVVNAKDGTYFHHPTGFFRYKDGNLQEVSRPVQDYIDAITLANYSKVCGWEDGDHVYWSVGDITLPNGVAVTSCVLRYTISTQTWTVYSYPFQFLVAAPYNDGTTLFRLAGNTNGEVLKINVGVTDNATALNYSGVHRWMNYDGLLNTEKVSQKVLFAHNGGAGTVMQYQTEESLPTNKWEDLGQLNDKYTIFTEPLAGRKVRFRFSGVSLGQPFTYDGFEVFEGSEKYKHA